MEAQEKGPVTMREYIDGQIEFVKGELVHVREKIAHEKELNTRDAKALTKALELQAEKYEERLQALNHEALRLSKMVTAEMFQEVVNTLRKEGGERSDRISKIELWVSNQEGKQSRAQWIAIAAMVLSIILFFIKK